MKSDSGRSCLKICRIILTSLLIFIALFEFAYALDPAIKEKMEESTVRVEAIVKLNNGYVTPIGNGSGFVVEGNHVVTNNHVLTDKQTVVTLFGRSRDRKLRQISGMIEDVYMVIALDKEHKIQAEILWRHAQKDLAILKPAKPLNKPAVVLAPSAVVNETQSIWVVGFPGVANYGTIEDNWYVVNFTNGTIGKKVVEENGNRKLYNTNAVMNPGNSGGPLFTDCGEVAGINVYVVPDEGGVGAPTYRAIQVDELIPVLESQEIPFQVADQTCGETSPAPSREYNWLLFGGIGLGIFLVVLFVILKFFFKPTDDSSQKKSQSQAKQKQEPSKKSNRAGTIAVEKSLFPEQQGLPSIHLRGNQEIILGRDPACEVVVDNTQLSRQHASFKLIGNNVFVTDLGSKNGTYLNGSKLVPFQQTIVKSSHRIVLGTEKVVYSCSVDLPQPNDAHAVILKPEKGHLPRINVTSARKVVGKGDVDVVISNAKISSQHCAIWLEGEQVMVRDLRSTNGTYVNNRAGKLTPNQPTRLRKGDYLILGTKEVVYRLG